jgi:hypothetical protein
MFYQSDNSILKFIVKDKCKKIVWLDFLKPQEILKKAELVKIYSPKYRNEKQTEFAVPKPAIGLYTFRNATLHIHSSHVVLDDVIVMERLAHVPLQECNYRTGCIEYYDENFAIINRGTDIIYVDEAFSLVGNGSFNYYHWTVEIASKIKYFLSSKLSGRKIKILLPEHVKNIDSFSTMFEILLANCYEAFYVGKNQTVKVEKLHMINTSTNLVFNISAFSELPRDGYFFDKGSLSFLRNTILHSKQYKKFLILNKKEVKRKVFLARRAGSVRAYNQFDAIELAKTYGYEPVYLETLTFLEQVFLFQNVESVIGPSGAAWTNLIYINKNACAISWLGDNLNYFPVYSTLAKKFGCNILFMTCKVMEISNIHTDYVIELDELEILIKLQANDYV